MRKPLFWTGLVLGSLVGYTACRLQKPLSENDNFKLNNINQKEPEEKRDRYRRKETENEFSEKINNLDKTLQKINRQES